MKRVLVLCVLWLVSMVGAGGNPSPTAGTAAQASAATPVQTHPESAARFDPAQKAWRLSLLCGGPIPGFSRSAHFVLTEPGETLTFTANWDSSDVLLRAYAGSQPPMFPYVYTTSLQGAQAISVLDLKVGSVITVEAMTLSQTGPCPVEVTLRDFRVLR